MDIFHMSDIIPLLGLPYPPYGRSAYNISCPCCDDNPRKKHLNINLKKMCLDVRAADSAAVCSICILITPAYRVMKFGML